MQGRVKKIFFIVDGGVEIGLGHVYQSIAFAKLIENEVDICFLTKSGDVVTEKIRVAGYIVHTMKDDTEILRFIIDNIPDIVIFDKIDVSEELAKSIKGLGEVRLVIFTNITNANRYADIAITAGIGSDLKNISFKNRDTGTLYLYGPKYWILREEFHEYSMKSKVIPEKIKSILITFGGSDPSNLTTLVTDELIKFDQSIKINILLGANFMHFDSLNKVLFENRDNIQNIKICRDVNNVAEFMFSSDLVITSPGLSAFEALYVGTPIILVPQNSFQKCAYEGLMCLIDNEEVHKLIEAIIDMNFTYPHQESIIDMNIGKGTEELISLILG